MRDVETSLPDASLVGFEYRLKEAERCKEKIADYRKATPDRSIEEITTHLPDAVRYTLQAPIDKYADTYRQACHSLRDRGNEMVRSVNSWDSNQYKGINTRWQTERGQPFEVQFHTPESFQAKQLSHDAYERIRNPDTSRQERRELRNLQSRISRAIHVPDGASEIPDFKKGS